MSTQSTLTEKSCSKCKEVKSIGEFNSHKTSASGYDYKCKVCKARYNKKYSQDNDSILKAKKKIFRKKNRESILEYNTQWRQENPNYTKEHYKKNKKRIDAKQSIYRKTNLNAERARTLKYYHDNRDAIRIKKVIYRKERSHVIYACCAKRRAAKIQRSVLWADHNKIKNVYFDCRELNLAAKAAGCSESFVVDHIIPLQGKLVSGLHVKNNLQIITNSENLSKSNKFTSG